MADDARAKRAAALEEKKKRLEELKKRRGERGNSRHNASSTSSSTAPTASTSTSGGGGGGGSGGGLDDYIDVLLNAPAPKIDKEPPTPTVSVPNNNDAAPTPNEITIVKEEKEGSDQQRASAAAAAAASVAAPVIVRKVEMFAAETQTEDDDFPVQSDSDEDEKAEEEKDDGAEGKEEGGVADDSSVMPPPRVMAPEEVEAEVTSGGFSTFLNSASKLVERLLGAPVLEDLLLGADYDEANESPEEKDEEDDDGGGGGAWNKKKKSRGHRNRSDSDEDASGRAGDALGMVSARVTFECTRWTSGRDCTDLDWSPAHRELMLSSYHMPSSSSSSSSSVAASTPMVGSTAVTAVSPTDTPSSSLVPRPGELRSDGLAMVWSLAMPTRPEHVFTCGSPVLSARFHPTEPRLSLGGCHSGQVVVWDARAGRLPVQRSGILASSGGSGGGGLGGHSHPVCSMEVVEGGSGLVTAATDGRLNFWSLANLRDPAESLTLGGSYASCLSVAPESNTVVVGDESGGLHAVLASTGTAQSPAATASSSKSSSSRRVVRALDASDNGHFGMVTGLSTKVVPRKQGANRGISRGFLRGSPGLVLTCGVDWTTKVWAPAYSDKPLLSYLSNSYDYMCDVQWNPAHPSLFATASSNGSLGFWNLATSLDEPISGSEGIVIDSDGSGNGGGGGGGRSSSSPARGLSKIKWSLDGRRIAVASSDRLHVLGISDEVSRPKGDEDSKLMGNLESRGLITEE